MLGNCGVGGVLIPLWARNGYSGIWEMGLGQINGLGVWVRHGHGK